MSRVVIKEVVFTRYGEGLFYMSACTNLTVEEAREYGKTLLSGTEGGWKLSEAKTFVGGEPHPCPCPDHPDRIHLLFEA